MRKTRHLMLAAALTSPLACTAAEDFLSDPSLLRSDPRFGDDRVYLADGIEERMRRYHSVMVDEPEIFIAPDSPYGGFKPSDMAALANMVRRAYIDGLTKESANLKVVGEES